MRYPRLVITTFCCLIALLNSGCANKQIAYQETFESLANETAESFAGDSERALNEAEQAYKAANNAELDFYAPLHMQQIRDSLKQARSLELEGNSDATIQMSAKVVALYEAGKRNKAKVEALLPALIQQKNTLDEIKANNILPGDYRDGMDDVKELISLIEAGEEVRAAKESGAVLADLQRIERDTMLRQHWFPARETLDKAEDEDADNNAAQTFASAEQLVDDAERIIRQSYSDRRLVEKTGKQALRAAQHALFIGREVSLLVKMTHAQAEQAALKFENYLGQIGSVIDAQDLRHMSLEDQTLALKQYAGEQAGKISAEYQKQIKALNALIAKLQRQQMATDDDIPEGEKPVTTSAAQTDNTPETTEAAEPEAETATASDTVTESETVAETDATAATAETAETAETDTATETDAATESDTVTETDTTAETEATTEVEATTEAENETPASTD